MKLAFDHYKFNTIQSNGVPVYWKKIPWANRFVYLRIAVCIGARHDPPGKEGLAHFFEHMPFKGCAGWTSREAVEKVKRQIFQDTLNATTTYEWTAYHGKVELSKFPQAIEFMRSFILFPLLDAAHVIQEREVITQEIWKRYENERAENLAREIRRMVYGDHTFSRIAIAFGWHNTVETMTRDELLNFCQEHYRNGNFRIFLAGDVNEDLLEEIHVFTAAISPGAGLLSPMKLTSWPNPQRQEYVISAKEYFGLSDMSAPRRSIVRVFRPMPIPANEQSLFLGRALVRQIMFDRVRGELGAMYSPEVTGDIFSDHAIAGISLSVSPEKTVAAREIISRTIEEISSADTRHEELFNEVKSAAFERRSNLDLTVEDISENVTDMLCSEGKITPVEESLDNLAMVSYDSVARLFKEQFSPEQLFWSVVTP